MHQKLFNSILFNVLFAVATYIYVSSKKILPFVTVIVEFAGVVLSAKIKELADRSRAEFPKTFEALICLVFAVLVGSTTITNKSVLFNEVETGNSGIVLALSAITYP